MPQTTTFDLPYPDDEEWLELGAYAIQQLADRLETLLTPATAVCPASASAAQAGIVGLTGASFDGLSTTGQFALSPDPTTLTYSGPPRWFMVDMEATAETTTADTVLSTRAELLANAGAGQVLLATSELRILDDTGHLGHIAVHRVTTPVHFTNGMTLQLGLSSSDGATFYAKQLNIVSIGAPES